MPSLMLLSKFSNSKYQHIWRKKCHGYVQRPRYPKLKHTERKFQFIYPYLWIKLTSSEDNYILKSLINHVFMASCPYFTFPLFIQCHVFQIPKIIKICSHEFVNISYIKYFERKWGKITCWTVWMDWTQ